MIIRTATQKDLPAILEMNEAALPHVSSVRLADMKKFLKIASMFSVLEAEDGLAGFMIVLRKGEDYPSLNYEFFCNNYSDFEYVDRIVIKESHKGQKMGTALYEHLFQLTDQKRVTCEVNLHPPNPYSMGFHKSLGFEQVAELRTQRGKKRVAMLIKRM